eukprot:UN00170
MNYFKNGKATQHDSPQHSRVDVLCCYLLFRLQLVVVFVLCCTHQYLTLNSARIPHKFVDVTRLCLCGVY